MSQTAKIIWGIIAVIVVIALIAWFARPTSDSGPAMGTDLGTVKLGFIGVLSGDASAYGIEIQRVLDYRLEQINEQLEAEGVNTRFEIVYEDGKCTGNDAVSAYQKLTDVDGVSLIIGGICSSETLAMAPLASGADVLVFSGWSSNPTIEGASPNVFSLSYSDEGTGIGLAEQMKDYSRVAIVTEQNDFNIGIRDVWEREIANYPNVTIVANETFPKGGNDFRNMLEKVRQANPEAVLLNPNPGVTSETLLSQLAEIQDWDGYALYAPFSYLADESRAGAEGAAEGMVIVDAPNLVDPDFLALKEAIVEEKGTLESLGNFYTASSLDVIDILTSLILQHGNDAKKVRDALATGSFEGFLGDIRFNGKNFKQGGGHGIYVVENGTAVYQE